MGGDVGECECGPGMPLNMGQHICLCQARALVMLGHVPKDGCLIPMGPASIRVIPLPRQPLPPNGDGMRSTEV